MTDRVCFTPEAIRCPECPPLTGGVRFVYILKYGHVDSSRTYTCAKHRRPARSGETVFRLRRRLQPVYIPWGEPLSG